MRIKLHKASMNVKVKVKIQVESKVKDNNVEGMLASLRNRVLLIKVNVERI